MTTIKEEYKYFIENCSNVPKSYRNYSDFSRICKTIASVKGIDSFDIYSVTSVSEFDDILKEVECNEDFQVYNKKGGNQYSNALAMYSRFLRARSFFKTDKIIATKSFKRKKPLQKIYYGAPGTGKSHTIKKEEDAGKTCIRTTFHPDSDYSTFVGCYKPHKCRETDTLTYEFVPQAFLEAYTQAWRNPDKEIALVIEEINRGNCAQIFGDIFQLLDRDKDGWSTYPIKADTDIAEYLDQMEIAGYSETMVKKYGESKAGYGYLALPPNMSLLATMNTSDQSLFPIDSAFKRRWDWKYVKIKPGKDKFGNQLNWKIVIKDEADNVVKVGEDEDISWWTFIEKINAIIASMTSSADKQLGYFFCKPTEKAEETDEEPSVISADTLVGKVIFYLWNDVFKDYGFEDAYLFSYLEKVDGKDVEKDLTFADFYDEEGEHVNTKRLADFLGRVMTWQKNNEGKE